MEQLPSERRSSFALRLKEHNWCLLAHATVTEELPCAGPSILLSDPLHGPEDVHSNAVFQDRHANL